MDIDTLRLEVHYTTTLNERSRMVLDLHQQLLALQQENAELKGKLEQLQPIDHAGDPAAQNQERVSA